MSSMFLLVLLGILGCLADAQQYQSECVKDVSTGMLGCRDTSPETADKIKNCKKQQTVIGCFRKLKESAKCDAENDKKQLADLQSNIDVQVRSYGISCSENTLCAYKISQGITKCKPPQPEPEPEPNQPKDNEKKKEEAAMTFDEETCSSWSDYFKCFDELIDGCENVEMVKKRVGVMKEPRKKYNEKCAASTIISSVPVAIAVATTFLLSHFL